MFFRIDPLTDPHDPDIFHLVPSWLGPLADLPDMVIEEESMYAIGGSEKLLLKRFKLLI